MNPTIRLTNSDLRSLRLPASEESSGTRLTERVFSADGEPLGEIEYVAIPAGEITSYGWRPVGSGWNRHQITNKVSAANALQAKTPVPA